MEDYGRRLTLLVADELQALRRERGLSLEELALVTGLHRTSIGLVFRGRRGLTIDSAARLSRALGVPLSDVLRRAEERAALD